MRKRIDLLKDPNTEFLEFSPLAAYGVYGDNSPAGAGLITGAAQISGRECVVVANNPSVKGGTYYPLTVKKHLRAQEVALENHLPCIYLVDSGGAFCRFNLKFSLIRNTLAAFFITKLSCPLKASVKFLWF